MEATKANDYAVAKELNRLINAIIMYVFIAEGVGVPEDSEIMELNRSYVLLGNELQKLYDRNPELAAIKPEPIWKRFDVLKTSTWDIKEYLHETDDFGDAHIVRVEKLCIIADLFTPKYSSEQQKLVDSANVAIENYVKTIEKVGAERGAKEKNNWQIPEYTLTYDAIRGTIKINDVYQLNKRSTNDSSSIDKILAMGMKQPNELIAVKLLELQTSKSLSSTISNAGFTPTLRKLFIPVARKGKGVLVRPIVTRTEADAEGIDTTVLDLQLKELGAVTEPKT